MSSLEKLIQKRQELWQALHEVKIVTLKLRSELAEINLKLVKAEEVNNLTPKGESSGPGRPKGYSMKLKRYFNPAELAEMSKSRMNKKPPGRPKGWRKSNPVNKE